MEIILLERIEKLGQMGDVVKVKDGYARNYLLPQKKALRSNKANLEFFEKKKAELEILNAKNKDIAIALADSLKGLSVAIVRQASESGHLYGSVTARDVYDAVIEAGHKIERRYVSLDQPFKDIGVYEVIIAPHPDVKQKIHVTIARSIEEAKHHTAEFFAAEAKAAKEAAEAAAALAEAEKEAIAEEKAAKAEKKAKASAKKTTSSETVEETVSEETSAE